MKGDSEALVLTGAEDEEDEAVVVGGDEEEVVAAVAPLTLRRSGYMYRGSPR